MSRILRTIVSTPRKQFSNGNDTLDLAYILPNLIVCAMPTSDYIISFFRMPVKEVLKFLIDNHDYNWRLFNFRPSNESDKGYSDEEFFGQVSHFPFLDHNPPVFAMIPVFVNSLDKYLGLKTDNVAVLHCKAGQGRSGTMTCSYLMMKKRMPKNEAIDLFTEKRMRSFASDGVSIYSQLRYLGYVEKYVANDYQYDGTQTIEISQVTITNLLAKDAELIISEYGADGETLKDIYTFDLNKDVVRKTQHHVMLKPSNTLMMSPDVCISINHKLLKPYQFLGLARRLANIKDSSAFFWFNSYWETKANEPFGSISLYWEDLDGFYGLHRRGYKTFSRIKVEWQVVKQA